MNALTLAPVSTKAAELLHALYAETLAAAAAALQVPPAGAIILKERLTSGLRATYHDGHGYRQLYLRKGSEYRIELQTPMLGDPRYEWQRPGLWYGSEEREDMQGRSWKSSLPCLYTTDNFGDLVEVSR
jgi:hypothetical protein